MATSTAGTKRARTADASPSSSSAGFGSDAPAHAFARELKETANALAIGGVAGVAGTVPTDDADGMAALFQDVKGSAGALVDASNDPARVKAAQAHLNSAGMSCLLGVRRGVAAGTDLAALRDAGARFALQTHTYGGAPAAAAAAATTTTTIEAAVGFAFQCQRQGLVPMLAFSMAAAGTAGAGAAATLDNAAGSTARLLTDLVKGLADAHVLLESMILCVPLMPAETADIAAVATLRVLQHTLPVAVAGVSVAAEKTEAEAEAVARQCVERVWGEAGKRAPWELVRRKGW